MIIPKQVFLNFETFAYWNLLLKISYPRPDERANGFIMNYIAEKTKWE